MLKHIFLYILSIMILFHAESQTVRGMVADQSHQPLIGATVLELGTQNGVVTGISGDFSLKLSSRDSKLYPIPGSFLTPLMRIYPK